MKAAVFEGVGKFRIKEVEKPRITMDDQILLKIEACSICGTDVHITADPPGYIATPNTILGHEFVARIVEVGPAVKHLQAGDRVVVNPNNYCGVCQYCLQNKPNLCENIEALGIDYDGAFAEYCVVHSKVAHRISDSVPAVVAACAEPLACVVNAMDKMSVRPGDSAVVIGGGPMGLITSMLLKKAGIGKLIHLETAPYRVQFIRDLGMADMAINPKETDAAAAVLEQTGGLGANFVVDATGSQMTAAIDMVAKGGQVVLLGVNKKTLSTVEAFAITTKEIRVSGTWLANATFPAAVRLLEQNAIPMERLITDIICLDDVKEGIQKLAAGLAIKTVIQYN